MRIVQSSDWRDAIPFDVPTPAADVARGEPTRCFVCGADSEPLDRSLLWAVKHRHPKNHAGYVRFYCSAHAPAAPAPAVPAPAPRTARTAARAPRREAPARRPQTPDVVRAMCPDCFVEVSATGTCGMCGRQVV